VGHASLTGRPSRRGSGALAERDDGAAVRGEDRCRARPVPGSCRTAGAPLSPSSFRPSTTTRSPSTRPGQSGSGTAAASGRRRGVARRPRWLRGASTTRLSARARAPRSSRAHVLAAPPARARSRRTVRMGAVPSKASARLSAPKECPYPPARMAILYKGAGPGSHWWTTDPRTAGGFVSVPMALSSAASAVRHITAFSHPSPYLSFSASFAVARQYALDGPRGSASAGQPGYVWEVDTAIGGVSVTDPLALIASAVGLAAGLPRLPTHHDGEQDLILGVAAPTMHPAALTSVPHRPGVMAAPAGPTVTPDFSALVFALRDAEVLVDRVPPACVVHRHDVY
jgi:hypothetical protein